MSLEKLDHLDAARVEIAVDRPHEADVVDLRKSMFGMDVWIAGEGKPMDGRVPRPPECRDVRPLGNEDDVE